MVEALREYAHRSVLNSIILMLMLVFVSASVFSFFGFIVAQFVMDVPLLSDPKLIDNVSDPELVPVLRLMQVLQAIGMMVVPSLLYLKIIGRFERGRSVFSRVNRQLVMLSVAVFLVSFPFINFLAEWNSSIEVPRWLGNWMAEKEETIGELQQRFLAMPTVWHLLFNLFMMAVLPALGEELVFRGVLQRGLQNWIGNVHLSVWIAAVLFSAVHMQFLGFVPRMLMGVALGYLFVWSGSLIYPIIAHFVNNATAIALTYGIQHDSIKPELETVGSSETMVAVFSMLFAFMLLFLFKQRAEIPDIGK